MLDFRPPLDTPWLISIVKILLPLYMKLALGDTTVSVSPEALKRFTALKGKRALICPNHSNRHDPQVMFAFSKLVGEDFNFIAAREVFDWDHGMNGWWLQHVGAYSVVRGAVDRESFKMTRELLTAGRKKLVLFPEGEISRQNDTLMPLESGAAQLSFWALSDVKKNSPDDTLHIIPMALKYTYPFDIGSGLRSCLKQLENKMGIKLHVESSNGDGQDHEDDIDSVRLRIRSVCEKLLTALEHEYRVPEGTNMSMNDRADRLRKAILAKVARRLNVELPSGQRELEHVRILRNAIDDFVYEDQKDGSQYEQKIHEEEAANIKACYRDLGRVVNFIAIYDGYVTEHTTQERCADVIDRLETEILGGEPSLKGSRRVLIDVGEPVDLSQYWADYKANKKAAVNKVTDSIYAQISSMLLALERTREPVYLK